MISNFFPEGDDTWKVAKFLHSESDFVEANNFLLSVQDLLKYKSVILEYIPPDILLSDKQITLMRFWELKNVKKIRNSNNIKDIFKSSTTEFLDEEQEVAKWRKGYIADLLENADEFNKLSKDISVLEDSKTRIANYYGLINGESILPPGKTLSEKLKEIFSDLYKDDTEI